MRIDNKLRDGIRWRWLIGETLVIVIGVLIALGIEQAWSDRQDREFELAYLKRIHADVLRDIDFVDGFSRRRLAMKMDALDTIGPVVRGVRPLPGDVETFFKNVSRGAIGGVSPTYFVRRSTFEDLISTGNLRLINDANLRTQIVSYYTVYDIQYNRIVERLTDYPAFVHGIVPAELRNELNLAAIQPFNVDRAIEQVMSDEFQTLLNREYNLGLFMRWEQARSLSTAKEFLQQLEAQIDELDFD